jgi:hypothetical protein
MATTAEWNHAIANPAQQSNRVGMLLLEMTDTASVATEGIIAAPLLDLWKVFTTSEGYKKLGVAQARVDARPGGVIWTSYDPGAVLGSPQSIGTEILTIELTRTKGTIRTRIQHPPEGFPFVPAHRTVRTSIQITPIDDQHTHLSTTMNGFDASERSQKMREFFASTNAWVLQKLQDAFANPSS